jgi:hypothetical protein
MVLRRAWVLVYERFSQKMKKKERNRIGLKGKIGL